MEKDKEIFSKISVFLCHWTENCMYLIKCELHKTLFEIVD